MALYDGISWQDRPDLFAPQLETFRHLRRIHELIELLAAAGQLPLPFTLEIERKAFLAVLCPDEMTAPLAETLATGPLPAAVRAFLKALAPHAAHSAR